MAETGGFSFANFYMRRARRLFPALFITLLAVFIVGYFMLPPRQLVRLCGSGIFAILSLSNFFFWSETGYFDLDATSKPLLHTWSLGVEEQFYLVWPMLIFLMVRFFSKRNILIPFCIGFLGCICILGTEYALGHDPEAAFFLTLFRVQEFAVGALLVWGVEYQPKQRWVLDVCVVGGMLLMIFAVMTYTQATPFPGLHAMVPCLGAGLVIYAGEKSRASNILRNKLVVGVGLISYSLYLVHWPLIVYYGIYSTQALKLSSSIALIAVSLLLAILMYKYIETPFRRGFKKYGHRLTPSTVGLICASFAILLICPAAYGWTHHGWPSRVTDKLPQAIKLDSLYFRNNLTWANIRRLQHKPYSPGNDIRVYIVGDSQAGDFTSTLLHTLPSDKYQIRTDIVDVRCGAIYVPLPKREDYFESDTRLRGKVRAGTSQRFCNAQWNKMFSDKNIVKANVIVLSSLWHDYEAPYIEDTIAKLRSISDAKIVLVGNKRFELGSEDLATKCALLPQFITGDCRESISAINRYGAKFIGDDDLMLDDRMRTIASSQSVEYLDLYDLFCGKSRDECVMFDQLGRPTYYDRAHINLYGIQYLSARLSEMKFLNTLEPKRAALSD